MDKSTLLIIPCCKTKTIGGDTISDGYVDPLEKNVSGRKYSSILETRVNLNGYLRNKEDFMPAVDRYAGYLYKSIPNLASCIKQKTNSINQPKLIILSALYGPLHPESLINDYELEMAKTKKSPWYIEFPSFLRDFVTKNKITSICIYCGKSTGYYSVLSNAIKLLLNERLLSQAIHYDIHNGNSYHTPHNHGLQLAKDLSCQSINKKLTRDVNVNYFVKTQETSKENPTVQKKCGSIHVLINNLERHNFPFDHSKIPLNGIYLLFEKKETGHGKERVVRIGTHTGEGQLCKRLNEHFVKPKKDRSIFRKNIGRAILNKSNDPFLKYWNIDLTTRKIKDKYFSEIDFEYQKNIENQVTDYIQSNFSFAVFEVQTKDERIDIESKLISTISLCNECRPSGNWLGNNSTKEKIVNSGLWQEQELYKTPFDEEELKYLSRLIKG